MKTIICFLTIVLAAICVSAQKNSAQEPTWHATVKVLDENGQPVTDDRVEVSYYVTASPDQTDASEKIQGLTDADGIFKASHENTGSIDLGFQATKAGYYPTTKGHEFAKIKDNDSAKWNPTVTLVLKKILQPIPMCAKGVLGGPSVLDQPVGYDLTAGDWVAPYGKGTNEDILFTVHKDTAKNDYQSTVTFPNPGDGIQEFHPNKIEEGSALISPHEAPASGYQPRFVRNSTDYNENRCYFFRVRSASQNGPLYGKIYGDFMNFSYYLNPTPNSRNIEFNSKENLIKHFKLYAERVNAP